MRLSWFARFALMLCLAVGNVWAEGDSAEILAHEWLCKKGLRENWNATAGTMVTVGSSSFTVPADCASGDFLRIREGAFSSAFRTMLREQIASVRMHMAGTQKVSRGTRTIGGTGSFDAVKDLLREWETPTSSPFVWRRKCIYDASGEEVALSAIVNSDGLTVMQTKFSGLVGGLHTIRFFQSFDKAGRVCEVAVVGLASPARSGEYITSLEQAVPMAGARELTSLDNWLKTRDIETLVGTRSFVDRDGHLWALGFAPVINGDETAARAKARFWASQSFGARVDVERCTLRGNRPEDDFYAMREVYDSRASVVGESYPVGLPEYRRLSGGIHPCCRGNIDVVVCILRDGAAKFREQRFNKNLEDRVTRDFDAGRKKSLEVARKVVERKLKSLSGPAAEQKRKALLEFLENLEHEMRDTEVKGREDTVVR